MGVLVATPLGSVETLPEDLVNGLFDLSPTEVRATNGFLQGKTIDELAVAFELSRETLRSQVSRCWRKPEQQGRPTSFRLLANVKLPKWHQAR